MKVLMRKKITQKKNIKKVKKKKKMRKFLKRMIKRRKNIIKEMSMMKAL